MNSVYGLRTALALIVNGKGSKHLWGSKTDIQISSHAQKCFLKVHKNGKGEHVPPPQPKSKAAHHYPQEVAKNAPVASQVTGPYQSSGAVHDSRCVLRPDSLSRPENLIIFAPSACWTCNSVPSVNVSHITKGVMRPATTQNCYRSRSDESSPKMPVKRETNYQGKGKLSKPGRALIVNGNGSKHFWGSKTDIQISSHSQKCFLKVQKNGQGEHVPPPQPKSKAAHHYHQEVAKNAPVASQVTGPFQSSGAVHDSRCVLRPDSLSCPENLIIFAPSACWTCNSVPSVNVSHITKDEVGVMRPSTTQNCYRSRSNESSPKMPVKRETNYQGKGKLSKPGGALIVNGNGSKHLWGSKTDIQISSHSQKCFLKVQKNGQGEHVPPPQTKSKAAHHYPQEVVKNAPVASQVTGPFQSSGAVHDSRCVLRPDSLSPPENLIMFAPSACWTCNSVPSVNVSHITKDEVGAMRPSTTQNCYRSRSNESSPKMPVKRETNYQGKGKLCKPWRGLNMLGRGFCSESDSRVGEIFESKHLKHLEKIYNKQIGRPNIELSRKQYLDIFAKLSRSEFPNFLKWVEEERVRVSSGPHVLGRKPIGRVGWLRPPTDFIKINTDGSFKDGMGGGGVVFRDSQGLVVRMYAVTFRKMRDELETELEAMHLGLFLANRFGYKNIVLESDHADLIRAIKSGKDVPDALFDQFQALPFHLVDDYEASYIPREGNKVADILSKYARLKRLWNNQQEGFSIALKQNSVDLQRLPYYRVEKEQEQQKGSNGEKKTIWVSGLRDWMDDDYLHRCFVSTGEVKSVRVIRHRETGLSAGYGFVEFFSHAAADEVLQSFAGKAMPDTGELFRLNWAKY